MVKFGWLDVVDAVRRASLLFLNCTPFFIKERKREELVNQPASQLAFGDLGTKKTTFGFFASNAAAGSTRRLPCAKYIMCINRKAAKKESNGLRASVFLF